jgi:hypothetical protein
MYIRGARFPRITFKIKIPIGAARFSSRALIRTENDKKPSSGIPKSGVKGNVGIQNEMKMSAHASAPPKRCIRANR